jgi:4-amino-4-deoxy-L-arabinose transferase-like glycosyltransferase
MPRIPDSLAVWAACAAIAAAVFFATYKLSESPAIWYDEGFFTQMAMNFSEHGAPVLQVAPDSYVSGATATAGFTLTYPVSLAYDAFGTGVIQGRAVMAVYLIIFVAAAYFLARILFGPWHAAAAAFLLASFPMLYGNGKSVLGEVPGLLFLILFLIVLVFLERSGFRKMSLWALAGLLAGLAAVTKPIFLLIVPAAGIAWLFRIKTIPLTLSRVAAGVAAFLAPAAVWVATQFGPGDSFETVLSFYANPYESQALLSLLASNFLKFFTEITPAYALVVITAWGASLFLRRKSDAPPAVAEITGFIFSLLVTAAFLRLPGWYRYLFPAIIPALIAFPFSVSTVFRFLSGRIRILARTAWLPVAGIASLVLLQFYQLGFHSYVADYYESGRTREMDIRV